MHDIITKYYQLPVGANQQSHKLRITPPKGYELIGVVGVGFRLSEDMAYNEVRIGVGATGISTAVGVEAFNAIQVNQVENSFVVNAGVGQVIYYAHPVRFGEVQFEINGVPGGFQNSLVVSSVSNSVSTIEDYYLYESTESALGSVTINIKPING